MELKVSEEVTNLLADRVEHVRQKALNIRKHICKMINNSGSGHPGGSLSVTDIMATLYFGGILKYDPKKPQLNERDYLILSKGHAAPALYAVLAEAGFFPVQHLNSLRKLGSPLQGHPDKRSLPGIEMSTGSLGQGLSASVGLTAALRLDNKSNRVVCVMGDGELQEGQIWEAAMSAAHYKLGNLTAVIDRNCLQIDGTTEEVMALGDVAKKFEAFGWKVIKVDGHNCEQLLHAFDKDQIEPTKPLLVLANTVKGKGVSFMEHNLKFHGTAPTCEECERALQELV
ncbi:MAG: transketolase [Candidatus Margulisiibacteriota bacterium]|nr:MAG: transketolase [Candidatus Margulisbacteria bacterium GWD2_39_127]OGI03655.1 MAG: transketolase [Candidatus Margulisbacteria bacterium GWF2_38_17]OGI05647.1 MAG: transketolase [Candidatus Margulisbacteria bacterium GWE2_39_32]PZM82242.1 MAG: transketolase [Candidatus Margulisiibacteriota bacterium]HAR63716.1 transketolase [Candidatus Margulisiibacteriota bacterium]